MSSTVNTIEVEHLTKFYGSARGVIDVSFSVARGEIMGFLGPNGSGKTTTMRILTCFFPQTSGTARICGFDTIKEPLEVRRKIGYLPESVPLYLEMPVFSYLKFFAEVKGIPSSRRKAKVDEVMQRCGIDSVACRLIGKLSKGFRQRVGIAQSLLHDPDVLILDEPTIGLDPKQIIDIRNLIRSLGGKQTVILSTHILPEVSMTCDRVIIIHEGRLVAVDTPANLIMHLQEVPTVLIKAEGPARDIMDALARVPGVLSVREAASAFDAAAGFHVETQQEGPVLNDLARTVCDHGWKLKEIRPVDMTLEDIFIKLVTKE
jgi:ABC-2 type transport system ATP-binding protein